MWLFAYVCPYYLHYKCGELFQIFWLRLGTKHQLASCAYAASSSSSIALWIRSKVTSSRILPLRRRILPSSPANGPDLIRTCLPAVRNGYGFAFQIANDACSLSISSSGRTAGLPLKLTSRIIP